jgi:predicted DsbA family dithiol-disulfide isomerase
MDGSYEQITMQQSFQAFRDFFAPLPVTALERAWAEEAQARSEAWGLEKTLRSFPNLTTAVGSAAHALEIDIMTDIRCPFSHVALHRLRRALANQGLTSAFSETSRGAHRVRVRLHPVFLNAELRPNEGAGSERWEGLDSYLLREHGITSEQSRDPNYPLTKAAVELGFRFNPNRRVVNTLAAFSAMEVATTNEDDRVRLFREISESYFTNAEDISETAVLASAAARAGLDVGDVSRFADKMAAASQDIMARYNLLSHLVPEVPTILLRNSETGDQKKLVGAKDVSAFEEAVAALLRDPARQSTFGVQVPAFGGAHVHLSHANPMSCAALHAGARNGYFPAAWPYSRDSFRRKDETPDTVMYSNPRLVSHLDDASRHALTSTYRKLFGAARRHKKGTAPEGTSEPMPPLSLLDVCSSWQSHYPSDSLRPHDRVAVLGLNAAELSANPLATERHVQDLNVSPALAFVAESFDFVTNTASIDYLVDPQAVLAETHRVLRPGGVAVVSFSNRCFDSKATAVWLEHIATGAGLMEVVSNFFHFSAEWQHINTIDVTPLDTGDPMWIVTAVKPSSTSRL